MPEGVFYPISQLVGYSRKQGMDRIGSVDDNAFNRRERVTGGKGNETGLSTALRFAIAGAFGAYFHACNLTERTLQAIFSLNAIMLSIFAYQMHALIGILQYRSPGAVVYSRALNTPFW